MTPTITAFERSPDRGKGQARDMRVRWALEEVVFRRWKGNGCNCGCCRVCGMQRRYQSNPSQLSCDTELILLPRE
jgi:hypothetical protein